jgi:hypothetical protein
MAKQQEYIDCETKKSVDTDDVFAEFTQTKLDVYQVGEDQKNVLYDWIKSGKVNLINFIIAWKSHKFEIDEKKINDEDYLKFIKCMKIIRQQMYKET